MHNPLHGLSIYLIFIVLLGFPIQFYALYCSDYVSPLFSASLGSAGKVSRV